jgi:hypothetical protein
MDLKLTVEFPVLIFHGGLLFGFAENGKGARGRPVIPA